MSEQRLYTEEEHIAELDVCYKNGICTGIDKIKDYLLNNAVKCFICKEDSKGKELRDLANSIGDIVGELKEKWNKKEEVKDES
jgi:hypothetical protein